MKKSSQGLCTPQFINYDCSLTKPVCDTVCLGGNGPEGANRLHISINSCKTKSKRFIYGSSLINKYPYSTVMTKDGIFLLKISITNIPLQLSLSMDVYIEHSGWQTMSLSLSMGCPLIKMSNADDVHLVYKSLDIHKRVDIQSYIWIPTILTRAKSKMLAQHRVEVTPGQAVCLCIHARPCAREYIQFSRYIWLSAVSGVSALFPARRS